MRGATLHGRPVHILLVEDNPADVRLTVEALKDAKVHNHLTVASDGIVALEILRNPAAAKTHTRIAGELPVHRPDLILLDLNLPRMDGREVLAEIKADPQLRRIPIVVLTTSEAEQDIMKAYELNANCYITKPVDLAQFLKVVRSIEDFWVEIVRLPPH